MSKVVPVAILVGNLRLCFNARPSTLHDIRAYLCPLVVFLAVVSRFCRSELPTRCDMPFLSDHRPEAVLADATRENSLAGAELRPEC